MVENKCALAHCAGECCRDFVANYYPIDEKRFLEAFPNAIYISGLTEENEIKKYVQPMDTNVYYYVGNDYIYFAVSGVCPNLNPQGSCQIHNKDFYPAPCDNLVPLSPSCFRKRQAFITNSLFREKLDYNNGGR